MRWHKQNFGRRNFPCEIKQAIPETTVGRSLSLSVLDHHICQNNGSYLAVPISSPSKHAPGCTMSQDLNYKYLYYLIMNLFCSHL